MGFNIGIGRAITTPETGGLLFGYNNHTRSESVLDDLDVIAFLLKSKDASALLISFAVCLIHDTLVNEIRQKAAAIAGISASHVIVSATHTHSAPPTTRFDGFTSFGDIDYEYVNNIFIPQCMEAVKTAVENMKPVKVGIGTTHSTVGINRRELLVDNTVKLGNNPWDHYDSTMTVISFVGAEDKKPVANVIHVGAHCTAIGNTHEITRDWAGVMVDRVEAQTGAMTMFINGTLGDVAPRMANSDSVGDLKLMKEVGGLAGIDAMRAFNTIKAYYDEPLQVICGELAVLYVPAISREDATTMLAACDKDDRFRRTSLTTLLKMYEDGNPGPDSLSYDQVIFRIGPAVLVPYPFEVSSEIGLRLRKYSPFAHTLTMSCTNGSHSYLPAQSQISRGGYEIDSFLWFRPRQMPDNADFLLIEQNLKLIEQLKEEV